MKIGTVWFMVVVLILFMVFNTFEEYIDLQVYPTGHIASIAVTVLLMAFMLHTVLGMGERSPGSLVLILLMFVIYQIFEEWFYSVWVGLDQVKPFGNAWDDFIQHGLVLWIYVCSIFLIISVFFSDVEEVEM